VLLFCFVENTAHSYCKVLIRKPGSSAVVLYKLETQDVASCIERIDCIRCRVFFCFFSGNKKHAKDKERKCKKHLRSGVTINCMLKGLYGGKIREYCVRLGCDIVVWVMKKPSCDNDVFVP
jgi:hypothetical protein